MPEPRPATFADAEACAAILNDWIDATEWMPRLHSHQSVVEYYRHHVMPKCDVWIAGSPVAGFLGLDPEASVVTALYVADGQRGCGIGRALLDHAKSRHTKLQLRTFVANQDAQAFYTANGFAQIGGSDGDNEERLPDILYEWRAV